MESEEKSCLPDSHFKLKISWRINKEGQKHHGKREETHWKGGEEEAKRECGDRERGKIQKNQGEEELLFTKTETRFCVSDGPEGPRISHNLPTEQRRTLRSRNGHSIG